MCDRNEALVGQLNRQTEMIGKLVRQLEGARYLCDALRRLVVAQQGRVVTQECEIEALRATVAELLTGTPARSSGPS